MEEGADYHIAKNEKGPLQRFKNQNLLLKKYGEVGLQIYKVITGKRTTEELRNDLEIDAKVFADIITYMEEKGMIELSPTGEAPKEEKKPRKEAKKTEIEPEEEKKEKEEETSSEIEIKPEEEFGIEEKQEKTEEDIEPLGELENDRKKEDEEQQEEEREKEEVDLSAIEPENEKKEDDDLSPVERIINDKYGQIGIQVYKLIDGQRTAEEIMNQTGLTESRLIEILDFMDEQGIIKLDYPKKKNKEEPAKEEIKEDFTPMEEELGAGDEQLTKGGEVSPVEIPLKAPVDIIKSVQLGVKTRLKFGDNGAKILGAIDGKNDSIDLSLKLGIPLYETSAILGFLVENRLILLKPLTRVDIKKKYGDDGFSVYKKYGREGLMLYELIGKDLTIKQMADKITKEKAKIVDMFLFIHQVLGLDLPIDRDILIKQLGI